MLTFAWEFFSSFERTFPNVSFGVLKTLSSNDDNVTLSAFHWTAWMSVLVRLLTDYCFYSRAQLSKP